MFSILQLHIFACVYSIIFHFNSWLSFSDYVVFCGDISFILPSAHGTNTSGPSLHILVLIFNMASTAEMDIEQEGQHPLTGQRAPPISGGT